MDDRERPHSDDREHIPVDDRADRPPRSAEERDRARSRSPAARSPNRGGSPRRGGSPPPRSYDDRRDDGRRERSDRGDDGEVNPGSNLYVANLSLRTRERDLEKLFQEYGKVSKTEVMYDPHSKESRGFAFVCFANAQDADNARAALSGKVELDGKVITVELAKRGSARTPTPGRYYGPPYRHDDRDRRGGGDRYRSDRYDDRRGGGDRFRSDRYDDRRRDRYDDRGADRYRSDRYDDRRDRDRRY
ncbi:uncharacterized protein EV422DRAFT_569988 [Fimicolochytrium jonesii]|uniref:uncharacterized protein n=1 Tax=Fimicolochytrium jonesii TaxID=1396493 RepID=UPI0022FEB8E9|nr:uncharacterized protein EV422DRAFT_569988 [Fimicolochytrium jonesii]KAI8818208.1 hypothetical protein EV422DRAFT_569988 [Fimicolochytrium jonesii]